MIEINYDAIKARRKELEKYPGYLPMRFYMEISFDNHTMFLDQKGLLDDGNGYPSELCDKITKARKASLKDWDEEFLIWIKEHPEFKDFLIEE